MSENDTAPAGPPTDGLFTAADTAGAVIAAVRPDQYDNRTPCPDYSVRELCNHLVSILRRITVLGSGGEFFRVPHFAEDVADGEWTAAWEPGVRDLRSVWSEPGILERRITLPWTAMPGAAAAVMYTNELVLHAWDLAKATGQWPEWDAAMLARPLAVMRQVMPAEPRGGQVPYGPVVDVPDTAPAIDRLAGWYGRKP